MIINIVKKSLESAEREFYYGAKVNKKVKDAYLGYGFLDPKETNRKEGPKKGHEEIILLLEGEIKINFEDESIILKDGDAVHLPDGSSVTFDNLTDQKVSFII